MSLLATVRGIPQLYYGSEIGMAGDKGKGDADIRQDFPGGWAGDAQNAFTKSGRSAVQNQFFDFTAKLFNWRKNNPVVAFGKMKHYLPEQNVYVYFRYDDNQSVMVIMNNADEKRTISTKRFAENIQNYTSGKEVMTNQQINLSNEISIDAKSVLILELKK